MLYKHPKSSILLKHVLTSIVLLGLFSCNSNKVIIDSASKTEVITGPKIVFINYTIHKQTNGKTVAKFLNSKKVDGKLKNQKRTIEDAKNSNDIICAQLDATSKIISETLIKNPLDKTLEYIDETKSFKAAKIKLDSTKFTVRLQLYPETKYIILSQINPDNSPYKLISTKRTDL